MTIIMYNSRLLEVIEKSEEEANEAMMFRVETAISKDLNISISKLTVKDKVFTL